MLPTVSLGNQNRECVRHLILLVDENMKVCGRDSEGMRQEAHGDVPDWAGSI